MMKQSLCKLTALRALLPFVITMLATVQAAAADYDYQVGVLYYKILGESTNVEVVAPPSGKYSGDIVVPASFKIGNVTYTVTAIGDKAFQAATVTSVKLPAEGITTIGGWAFNDCTGLTSFVLPASITSIGQRAFYCCDKLQHLWAEASDPAKYNVASEAFSSINRSGNTCTIHAPIGQAATYQNSDVFKDKKFAFAECVFINSTTFPDKNFRNYILAQDYGEDIVLTEEEIAAVTEISVPSMDIIKLQGLEFFTALKILDCSGNALSSINVEKNTALTDLDCSNNYLSSINVGKNKALTDLDCSNNYLSMSGLDINNNTELGILICDNCSLTKLDVSKNTNLKRISCCQNQLTSLDLSKNIALMNLYCRGNKISGNDMSNLVNSLPSGIGNNLYVCGNDENEGNEMTTMQVAAAETKGWTAKMYDGANWVDYAGAQVMAIDEAHFPDANFRKWLLAKDYGKDGYLSEKEIAGIDMIEVDEKSIADLTGIEYFTALTGLSCWGNLLTKLDVSKNKALEYLECDKNQLTELDVSNNTKLEYFSCCFNQLTTLDLSKNLSIEGFFCFDNQIRGKGMEDLVKNLPPVSNATLVVSSISEPATGNEMTTAQVAAAKAKGWNVLMWDGGENYVDYAGVPAVDINATNFPDANFRAYVSDPSIDTDESGYLTEAEIAAVTEMSAAMKDISNLKGIEHFTALTSLDCLGNKLTSLDLSKNTALTKLICAGNQLSELDVTKNTTLTYLDCDGNKLTALDLSKNTALEQLYCDENQLTTLNVTQNKKLTLLSCYSNKIYGDGMQTLVGSLHSQGGSPKLQVYTTDAADVNKMTKAQVAAAEAKGWTILMWDGSGWAVYNGITPGDANGDGVVNVADIVAITRSIKGLPVTGFSLPAADMNDDGKADKDDIPLVQKIIMKK